jgi:hypothetical protein
MADDSGEDLVSNVKVTGTEEATAQLEAYGDKGAAAFGKINEAAAASAAGVGKSSKKIQSDANDTSNALNRVNNAVRSGGPSQKALNDLSKEASNLSRNVVKTSRDIAQFATRIAALATAGAAAIAGIAKLGASVAQQLGQTTSAFDENNQAQQRAVAQNLSASQAAIQYANQQRQLNRQLADGTIDYDTYSNSLKQNKQAYRDQIRVTAELQAAQEDARIETEKLQKVAADRKAYDGLVATFGGPLTSALVQLGNVVIGLKNDFVQSFGPGAAAFVSTLTGVLNANAQAISNFFGQASDKIQTFVSQNGPAIQNALESIGTAAAAIFNGLIGAAPQLLSLFNNQIVPAFRALASIADQVTRAFNSMFGTNFSTGALVVIAIIANLTGGIKTLLAVGGVLKDTFVLASNSLKLLGVGIAPLQIAVLALAAAFIILNTDWTAFGQNLLTIWNTIVQKFSGAVDVLVSPFTAAWQAIQDGWTAATQFIVNGWNSVADFFNSIPGFVVGIFAQVGQAVVNAFTSAFDTVTNYVKGWVESIMKFIQPIIDSIKAITSATGSTGEDSAPAFAGGGKVRGAGTSTSDDILAWLSNNEYVVRAKAVRKYGTAFLNAINSGSLDLRGIVRGFAAGGSPFSSLAPAPLRFAPQVTSRGENGGVLNLTIDGNRFDGLIIPDRKTSESLIRYATSGGRKPSWTGKNKR